MLRIPITTANGHLRKHGEDAFYQRLARNIKEIREDRGISQRQLAKTVGYTNSTLSSIEHGRMRPALFNLLAFCIALEVSLDQLLNFSVRAMPTTKKDRAA